MFTQVVFYIKALHYDICHVMLVDPKPVRIRSLKHEAEARMVQRNNSFRNRMKR